jgi:tetratricopeptide (TPR) repeat protein
MKPSFFIILSCFLFNACSNAQTSKNTNPSINTPDNKITYEEWKEEVRSNIRLSPKYGDAVKSQGQQEADHQLIEEYTKQQGTRPKASEVLVKHGFDYLYRGDLKTAMYRFNQAWILDPKNENVFWGFAVIYFNFGDFDNAMKELNEGLELNPQSSNILTDMATIHMVSFQTHNDPKELSTAIDLFTRSYAIDPKNQNTLFKLSAVYFMKKDCTNALKYYNECKALGGKPLTKEYIQAIEKGCANK